MDTRNLTARFAFRIAVLLATASANPAQAQVSIDDHTLAVMILVLPKGASSGLPSSAYLESADRALRTNTGIALLSSERAGIDDDEIDACGFDVRFSCWVQAVRSRWTRNRANNARYLFVLAAQPGSSSKYFLRFFALDLELAGARIDAVNGQLEAAEASVFKTAIHAPPQEIAIADSSLDAYFEEIVAGPLRAMIEPQGDWHPYGSITVESDLPEIRIRLDGREIGAFVQGRTRIDQVRSGDRHIVAYRGQQTALDTIVSVVPGEHVTVHVQKQASAEPIALLITGAVTAVAGSALTCAGIARDDQPVNAERQITFISHFEQSDRNLLIPIGLAAAGAGITWSLSAALLEEEGVPWISWLLGLASGATIFGVSYAIGG